MKIKKDETNVENIKKAIQMRLAYIRDKNIVKNAIEVVRKCGNYKSEEESCYIREKGTFAEVCGNELLKISFHSFGQFHENQEVVEIWFGEKLVFKGKEIKWPPNEDEKEKSIKLKDRSSSFLVVDTYREGEWENFANVKYVKTYHEFAKKERLCIVQKQKEDEEIREFLERAESVMEDLGIELR